MPNSKMPDQECKLEKDDLSIINDVRKKAWKLIYSLHILSGDDLRVVDFDLSKARPLSEFKSWPNFHEEILQGGRELAEALKKDFFGSASRVAKHGTEVEKTCIRDACGGLSIAVRQFRHFTKGMPSFKEVAEQLDNLDTFEKELLRDLAIESTRKRRFEIVQIIFAPIGNIIKCLFGKCGD